LQVEPGEPEPERARPRGANRSIYTARGHKLRGLLLHARADAGVEHTRSQRNRGSSFSDLRGLCTDGRPAHYRAFCFPRGFSV